MSKEIKVFKNESLGTVVKENGEKYILIGDEKIGKFELLALAVKFNQHDKDMSREVLNLASMLYHTENDFVFNTLYSSVVMDIAYQNHKEES